MKDIDFDELDRAVSSVLSKKTTDAPVDTVGLAAPQSVTPVTPIPQDGAVEPVMPSETTTEPVVPEPTVPELSPAPEPVAVPDVVSRTVEPSPLMVKPRGKFMDVMHPSADMNPGTSDMPLPAMPAAPRILQPLNTPLLSAHTEDDPVEISPPVDESQALIGAEPVVPENETEDTGASANNPFEPKESPLASESSTSVSDVSEVPDSYVDPLDMPSRVMEPDAPKDDESRPSSPIPQTTPFLSDTKVDKRPLGAFGENEEAGESEQPDADEVTAQTAPEVPLPRELQADVVQVESIQETDQITAPVAPMTTDKPFATTVSVPTVDDDGRVEGHPLFDTSTYHEPIAAVHAKKTAPWIIWLVGLGICLVIGAGVGYFLFRAGL